MADILSNQEKAQVVDQHIKNLEYSLYGIDLTLIEENALTDKNTSAIAELNAKKSSVQSQIAALEAEKASLTVTPEA